MGLNRLIFATNLPAAAELSKVTMRVFKLVSPFLAGYSVIAPSRSYFTASDFVCLFVQGTAVFTPHFYSKHWLLPYRYLRVTTKFHFSMIYLLILRPAPLSGLFFLAPCRGWAHFLLVLHIRPSSARCLGQIVLVAPSSLNKPTRARIKSFSVDTVVWDTLTCLRWDLTSLVQDVTGKYSLIPGYRGEMSHLWSENDANVHERLSAIVQRATLKMIRCHNVT